MRTRCSRIFGNIHTHTHTHIIYAGASTLYSSSYIKPVLILSVTRYRKFRFIERYLLRDVGWQMLSVSALNTFRSIQLVLRHTTPERLFRTDTRSPNIIYIYEPRTRDDKLPLYASPTLIKNREISNDVGTIDTSIKYGAPKKTRNEKTSFSPIRRRF